MSTAIYLFCQSSAMTSGALRTQEAINPIAELFPLLFPLRGDVARNGW